MLLELAVRGGRVLQVGHLERFNPAIRALGGRVTQPRFIECQRLAQFGERGTDVDVVLDLMIHDLDVDPAAWCRRRCGPSRRSGSRC